MDVVTNDLFDNVDLDVEDKVIFSAEIQKIIREEIQAAIAKLPIGSLVQKVISKEVEKQRAESENLKNKLDSQLDKTKELLKSTIDSYSKDTVEFKQKINNKFDDFLNKYSSIGEKRLYFGGPAAIRIQEEDGANLGYPTSLKFPTGSITINSDGSYSIGFSGPVATTHFLLETGDDFLLETGDFLLLEA